MEVKESQAKMALEVGKEKFHKWLVIEIFSVCWLRYVSSPFPCRDETGRLTDVMVEHETNRMVYSKVRRHELISVDNTQHSWNCPSLSCNCIFSQNNIHTSQKQIHYSPSVYSSGLYLLLLLSSTCFPKAGECLSLTVIIHNRRDIALSYKSPTYFSLSWLLQLFPCSQHFNCKPL